MVNMGAIKMCTLIHGKTYAERFQRLLDLTRLLTGNKEIEVDESVYTSEKQTGSKNRALAYLLQSNGLLNDNVEEVLDCYFKCCSIRVNSMDLASALSLQTGAGCRIRRSGSSRCALRIM